MQSFKFNDNMKKNRIILIFSYLMLMATLMESCHDLKKRVDLIIYNAKIYVPDSLYPKNDCLAVKDGKIYLIGTDSEIRSRYWADENINAKGLVVYPGFIDAHAHFIGLALSLRYADLNQAKSFDEVIKILQDYRKIHPDSWIVGRCWDQNKWPDKKFPVNTRLNKLFPGVPVVLTRIDGHAVLASQAAIDAAKLNFPGKKGEALISAGKFTGIFLETMADQVKEVVPQPSTEELARLIGIATKRCHEAGLTAVTDAGLEKKEILLLDSLQKTGKLQLRIDAWISPTEENISYFMKKGVYKTPFLRVGAIKLYADGALGSRGACLLKPYTDDRDNYGIALITPEELVRICKIAYEHDYQVNTHAIGDSAVRIVLHAYAKILHEGNDRRWRIEHCQVVNSNDFEIFRKFKVIPSVQATHATSDMGCAEQRLGKERIKTAYAYKQLLDQNSWIPNGTDFPIEGIEPLHTFYAAVARKNLNNQPAEGFQKENALSRMEALKSITTWAAKSSFSENLLGSLTIGHNADITILDSDLLKVNEDDILKSNVKYTIVNGKIVYKAKY